MKKVLSLLFTATLLTGLYFNISIAVITYWIMMCLVGFVWVLICCSDKSVEDLGMKLKDLKMNTFSIIASLITFPMYVYVIGINERWNMLFCYALVHLLIIAGQIKLSTLTKEEITNE